MLILVEQRVGSLRLWLGLRGLPPIVQPLPAQRAADGLKVIDDLGHGQSFALSICSTARLPPQNSARAVMWVTPRQSVTAFAAGAPLRRGIAALLSVLALTAILEVGEELSKELFSSSKLVPERATHGQVVDESLAESVHGTSPGQERAIVRRASRSAFA